LKKFTLPVAAIVLVVFNLYLILQIVQTGNSGNCGCFGEYIKMTPLQAILKNSFMLLLILLIYKFYSGWKVSKNALLLSSIGTTALLMPFILNPIDFAYSSNNLQEKVNYSLDLDLLYFPEDSLKVEKPSIDLRDGKHVLAFMSLSCPHCRIAAKKFHLIKRNSPKLSIYFVLNGDKAKLKQFHMETKTETIPYSFCLGKTFVHLASAQLPRIYYLENSTVVKKVDYYELSQYDLENWMLNPKK